MRGEAPPPPSLWLRDFVGELLGLWRGGGGSGEELWAATAVRVPPIAPWERGAGFPLCFFPDTVPWLHFATVVTNLS